MRKARPQAKLQQGFAIFALVMVILLGLTSAAVTFYRPAPQIAGGSTDRTDLTAAVKTALIGYATRQGVFECTDPSDATACQAQLANSSKLGELPCPDLNNDGVAEASCTNAAQRLGRVPWKTLGIPNPRDNYGETLWYSVSSRFLGNASNPIVLNASGRATSGAINSSTPGSLTVLASDNSTISATAVAVIIAPGTLLAGQKRDSANVDCGTSGTIANNLCPANYLEAQGNGNNALPGKAFIVGTQTDTFNDRVAYLSTSELIPMLEMRVGNEFRSMLLDYKFNSDCFCYPWADSWAYSGGIGDFGVNRGRLASTANDDTTPAVGDPQNWGTGSIPRFPQWVFNNDWHNQVYYIVSRAESHQGRGGCLTCTANAYINVQRTASASGGSDQAAAVIITPGTPRPGKTRYYLPADLAANTAVANDFTAYFEDSLNQKSGCAGESVEHASTPPGSALATASNCDTLQRPSSKAPDRDRLFILKPDTTDLVTLCSRGGPALFKSTPCMDPHDDNKVKNVCDNLIGKLQLCSPSCAAAAAQMGVVPCRNNRSAAECPPYHAALLACKP